MDDRKAKRDAPLSIRLSKAQRAVITADARSRGLSRNAYVLSRLIDGPELKRLPIPREDFQAAATLMAQAARFADLSRAMEARADDPLQTEILDICREELAEIRSVLMALTGREP